MKKSTAARLLSALLIFILAFSLFSCENGENEIPYNENLRLEIAEEEVIYSEELILNINSRFTNLAALITEAYLDIKLKDTQKQSISENFNKTILPVFYRVKIYEDEIENILSAAEEAITENGIASPHLLYESILYNLGSRKSGMLFFEISLMIVKNKEETALERYEKYGYSSYLADAERCSALMASLTEIGEEKFVEAFSAAAFITSTIFSINLKTEENAFMLEDAELLYLLERQAEIFNESSLTDSEWQTVGALITELIPKDASGITLATLYALKNDGYFNNFARVMPQVLSLYASVAKALNDEALFSLEAEDTENKKAILSAVLKSENDVKALDAALMQYAKTNSERLKNAVIANADSQALETFFNTYEPISSDMLISSLKELSEKESIETSQIKDLFISYLSGFSPYIAFVIFN